ncbi:MAG TPA: hypothetical protein VKZ99_00440 [Gammaproteobacteria bacterium]|nr:hypothetical protein [Gammaproteobacteria bacterium]
MDMRLKRVSVNVLAVSLVLTTLLPLAIMAVTLLPARIDWMMAVPTAIFVAALGSGITFAITRNHARLEHGRLRLRAAFYSRDLPVQELRLDEAEVLAPGNARYAPSIRTNGIGLPGYQAGWFRARIRERLFVAVPRTPANLYIPTTQGYALLLAVEDPAGALRALQASLPAADADSQASRTSSLS